MMGKFCLGRLRRSMWGDVSGPPPSLSSATTPEAFTTTVLRRNGFIGLGLAILAWLSADVGAEEIRLEFRELAPGTFVYQGVHEDMNADNAGAVANLGFVIGERSVAVIDAGGSPAVGRAVQRAIAEHTTLPISHLVLTHVHPDHLLGAGSFSDTVQRVAHERFPVALIQRAGLYFDRYDYLFEEAPVANLFNADSLVQLDEPMIIDLGGRSLELRAWPTAHTDHDLTVFDMHGNTLWMSDLLFSERLPAIDGSLKGWLALMDELDGLDPGLVVPGHGSVGSWAAVATPQKNYLEALLENTRRALARGETLREAIANVPVAPEHDWQLEALHHPMNVTRAYTELEWE